MAAAEETAESGLARVLDYAARGWPVLPVWGIRGGKCACKAGAECKSSAGKHPLSAAVRHGVKDASLDAAVIREWFRKYPGCNWAVATGGALPGGGFLVCIDVDPRNGGDESLAALEREHGELPGSVRQISGGAGAHIFCVADAAMPGADLAEGIEFKASGGYVIVDDYNDIAACRQAVTDYRSQLGIRGEIVKVDWTGVYWKKQN